MSGIKMLLTRVINSYKALYWIFAIVVTAHLFLFIKYPYSAEVNLITVWGEQLKAWLPVMLLFILIPRIHRKLDKVISTNLINKVSLVFIFTCVTCQIIGVSGQAWSTVAFSGLLILLLFNNLVKHYDTSRTKALVFSFMVVWLGWVIFEIIFQIGLWFYYPQYFQYKIMHLWSVMIQMGQWAFPAILFIAHETIGRRKIAPEFKLNNYRYFTAIIIVSIIAVSIWYYNNMLIPLPPDTNGIVTPLVINYWTQDHLWFSVSRLSQISIMSALPVLFLRKGIKN